MSILPTSFLVHYSIPVPRNARLPRGGGKLLDLPASARVTWPAELERAGLPVELRAAWNPQGIGFSLTVTGRTLPALSDPESPAEPDSLELWIDTRDMQTVHRATRYCHHYCILPVGGGNDGRQPVVVPLPVARAAIDAPQADPDVFLASSKVQKTGYTLEVWMPAEALTGFDPVNQPRFGFYCQLNDAEHGTLPFGVGEGFPYASDPSLWHSLELRDA